LRAPRRSLGIAHNGREEESFVDIGKFFSFDGRVSRGTFWGITALSIIAYLIAYFFVASENAILIIVAIVLYIVLFVVSLATSIKRWHDRDKSGWWILISLVPIIGGLWALIEQGFLAGTEGPNQYGLPASGSPFDA
jgi:uncharacterized membrane protein YhaH (DUF805 family)